MAGFFRCFQNRHIKSNCHSCDSEERMLPRSPGWGLAGKERLQRCGWELEKSGRQLEQTAVLRPRFEMGELHGDGGSARRVRSSDRPLEPHQHALRTDPDKAGGLAAIG